jgi:hypothetical protein
MFVQIFFNTGPPSHLKEKSPSGRGASCTIVGEEVEGDQGRGRFDPPSGQATLQSLKVDPRTGHHHQLAVQSRAPR